MLDKQQIEQAKATAVAAGEAILNIYNDADFSKIVDFKDDNSPLTLADKESHKVIAADLEKNFADIPVISEEGKDISYAERKDWGKFWLVDPLDGTKEFIKRNGEFTVNIALIENGKPVFGVVYVPVKSTLYWIDEQGRSHLSQDGSDKLIKAKERQGSAVAVRSKSHASPEEEVVLQKYNVSESISRGSSLKFCMVAEGRADIYYRHGPTMEWDTAAGQAIVLGAGGKVYIGDSREEFEYNKESLLNGSFLCVGQGDY